MTYFALYTGLVPLFTAVQVPGLLLQSFLDFLVGGWQQLLQVVVLTMSLSIYRLLKMDALITQKKPINRLLKKPLKSRNTKRIKI